MDADLVISFKVYRERSAAASRSARTRIASTSNISKGPSATSRTTGTSIPARTDSCEVDFFVDFEFRSAFLQRLIGLVFQEAMHRIVRAFERRAAALYGHPHQRLKHQLERGLHAPGPALLPPQRAECALHGTRPSAVAVANQTRPSGLLSDAPGPGDPGDRHRDLGARRRERPLGHRPRDRLGHRAMLGQELLRHPQKRHLRRIGIAHEAAVEDVRRSGDVGDRRADQPAGAALGGDESSSPASRAASIRARAGSRRSHQHPVGDRRRAIATTTAAIAPAMTSSSMTPSRPARAGRPSRRARASRCRRGGRRRTRRPSRARERRCGGAPGEPEPGRERARARSTGRPPRR